MPGIKDWGIYVALIFASMTAMAGTPHLTLDINTQAQPRSSMPTLMGTLNGSVYFSAFTTPGASTSALFKSDGTAGGTTRVKDINGLGVLLNFPSNLSLGGVNDRAPLFFAAGSKAYFAPVENTSGQEVWVTDGTSEGTHIVADLYPGQGGDPLMLGVLGTDLIFFESTSNSSRQIYKTDGTAAGTVALTQFGPAPQGSGTSPQRAGEAVVLNGKMYFILDAGLWVTDGTPAGTRQLGGSSILPLNPFSLTVFENSILFIGTDVNSGNTSLLRIDPAYNVPQLIAGAQYRGYRGISSIAVMDGYVLYVGYNSQLWKYNGSSPVQITSFAPPSTGVGPLGSQDTSVTRVGDHAIFRAQGSPDGPYLWSTDGTTQGTVPLIADPDPVNSGALPLLLGVEGNHGYFIVSTGSGAQIAVTDGTGAGTHLLAGLGAFATIDPGYLAITGSDSLAYLELIDNTTTPLFTRRLFGYVPQTNTLTKLSEADEHGSITQLLYNSGTLFFDAWNPVTGQEPWVSDGSVAGTHQLQNIEPESLTDDSHPASLVDFGGKVAFVADDGLNDGSIWISDGTAAGTTLLPNVAPANGVYLPSDLVSANGALYFFAYGNDIPSHFMRVGKPGDAPQTLADLASPACNSSRTAGMNGELYFVAATTGGPAADQLYKTDGTASGTVLLLPASTAVGVCSLYTVGNRVFFQASNSLWSTDGTQAGTVQVPSGSNPIVNPGVPYPVLNGKVYFATTDASMNAQLWMTDGTATGTVMTASFPATNNQYNPPVPVAVVNGKLLLETALPSTAGGQLSVSDGTGAGTVLSTPAISFSTPVTVIGSKVYFAAANSNGGNDPWVTDGTQAGTLALTSAADTQYASPAWFAEFNGTTVLEVTNAGYSGSQLYQTDGTPAGTKLIGPIGPTPVTTPRVFPREHLVVGQDLFFPAVDTAAGAELFVLPNNPPAAAADTASSDKDAAVTINVLANDTDSDGSLNTATVAITNNPVHGSVAIGTGGSVTYTPTAGYSGQDTFAYTVTDNQGAVSAPAQVTVSVTSSVTVSTGGDSGSGSKGGGGSLSYLDVAFLMALMLQLSIWRLRRGRLA